MRAGAALIVKALHAIAAGDVTLVKQGEGTLCRKVSRTQVDFSRPAREVSALVRSLDECYSMHDFRTVPGEHKTNVIFEVAVPFDCKLSDAEIERRIRDGISLSDENLDAVVTVERQ